MRQRCKQRKGGKDRRCGHEHPASAEVVGSRAEDQGAEEKPDLRCAEYRAKIADAQMQRRSDRGCGRPEQLTIESIDKRNDGTKTEHLDLNRTQTAFLDQPRDIQVFELQ